MDTKQKCASGGSVEEGSIEEVTDKTGDLDVVDGSTQTELFEIDDSTRPNSAGSSYGECQSEESRSSCSPEAQGPARISWEEKLKQANSYKNDGNSEYKNKQFKKAIGKYHRALLYIKGIEEAQHGMPFMPETEECELGDVLPDDAKDEIAKLKLDCFNNLAACILQTPNPVYEKVIKYCDNVIKIAPENTKALYRKGVALYHTRVFDKAQDTLLKARKTSQGDSDPNIQRYISMCEKELAAQDEKQKKTFKAMFTGSNHDDSDDVFTNDANDPDIVKPQRKTEKARSTDIY